MKKMVKLSLSLAIATAFVSAPNFAQSISTIKNVNIEDYTQETVSLIVISKKGVTDLNVSTLASTQLFNTTQAVNSDGVGYDLGRYFVVNTNTNNPYDVKEIIAQLESNPAIEKVFVKPVAESVKGFGEQQRNEANRNTEVTEADQVYLLDKINGGFFGVNAKQAWDIEGGRGDNVDIVSMECGPYFYEHEDLTPSFTELDDPTHLFGRGWHDTMSVGIMTAKNNGYGVTGIAHNARQGWVDCESGHLIELAHQLKKGSVIQIGVHIPYYTDEGTICEDGCYVPVIAFPWWRDSIRYATSKGIHVVMAAGNGHMNLDDPFFEGINEETGGIVVGASYRSGQRAAFSNYGSIVQTFSLGEGVATTYGGSENNEHGYTTTYSGTSSANPIVAASVASLQGIAQENGIDLTPMQMRQLIIDTGREQMANRNDNIGVQPNIVAAANAMLNPNFVPGGGELPEIPTAAGVTLYVDKNYSGHSLRTHRDMPNLFSFADQISSVEVPVGWGLELYTEPNFGGTMRLLTYKNVPEMYSSFDDKIKSVRVKAPKAASAN